MRDPSSTEWSPDIEALGPGRTHPVQEEVMDHFEMDADDLDVVALFLGQGAPLSMTPPPPARPPPNQFEAAWDLLQLGEQVALQDDDFDGPGPGPREPPSEEEDEASSSYPYEEKDGYTVHPRLVGDMHDRDDPRFCDVRTVELAFLKASQKFHRHPGDPLNLIARIELLDNAMLTAAYEGARSELADGGMLVREQILFYQLNVADLGEVLRSNFSQSRANEGRGLPFSKYVGQFVSRGKSRHKSLLLCRCLDPALEDVDTDAAEQHFFDPCLVLPHCVVYLEPGAQDVIGFQRARRLRGGGGGGGRRGDGGSRNREGWRSQRQQQTRLEADDAGAARSHASAPPPSSPNLGAKKKDTYYVSPTFKLTDEEEAVSRAISHGMMAEAATDPKEAARILSPFTRPRLSVKDDMDETFDLLKAQLDEPAKKKEAEKEKSDTNGATKKSSERIERPPPGVDEVEKLLRRLSVPRDRSVEVALSDYRYRSRVMLEAMSEREDGVGSVEGNLEALGAYTSMMKAKLTALKHAQKALEAEKRAAEKEKAQKRRVERGRDRERRLREEVKALAERRGAQLRDDLERRLSAGGGGGGQEGEERMAVALKKVEEHYARMKLIEVFEKPILLVERTRLREEMGMVDEEEGARTEEDIAGRLGELLDIGGGENDSSAEEEEEEAEQEVVVVSDDSDDGRAEEGVEEAATRLGERADITEEDLLKMLDGALKGDDDDKS